MANADVFSGAVQSGMDIDKKKKDKKAPIPGFKNGGKVKKTGIAKVHKGEVVLTAQEAKGYSKKSPNKKHSRKKVSSKR